MYLNIVLVSNAIHENFSACDPFQTRNGVVTIATVTASNELAIFVANRDGSGTSSAPHAGG